MEYFFSDSPEKLDFRQGRVRGTSQGGSREGEMGVVRRGGGKEKGGKRGYVMGRKKKRQAGEGERDWENL